MDLAEAEAQIMAILARVESENDVVVTRLLIEMIDVSTLLQPKFMRKVYLEVVRPGEWG